MVVNFRARGISRGARKLARTPTIIKKKKKNNIKTTYLQISSNVRVVVIFNALVGSFYSCKHHKHYAKTKKICMLVID
jgi:hypothetical protein